MMKIRWIVAQPSAHFLLLQKALVGIILADVGPSGFVSTKLRITHCNVPSSHWISVCFSGSQVVQYQPRGPRAPSGPSPSLSALTSEAWTILRRSLCPSLCPSSSSSSTSSSLEVSATRRRRRRQWAAPTPRTDTPPCYSWTASSLTRRRPQVGRRLSWGWMALVSCVIHTKKRRCNGVFSLELQWRTFFHSKPTDR